MDRWQKGYPVCKDLHQSSQKFASRTSAESGTTGQWVRRGSHDNNHAPLYLRTLRRYTNPILLLLLVVVVVVVFPSRQNIHLRQTKMKQLNEIKIANDEKVFANADGRRKFQ